MGMIMKTYEVKYKVIETNRWNVSATNRQTAINKVKKEYTDKHHKVEILSVKEV